MIVELQLLRSQLHPHFLFNTLNNLYSLTLERSYDAPHIVLKLSALLRYILYECNEPTVELGKEVQLLKNYIELEQSRFGERVDISISCSGDIQNRRIAPLLLLPFVENSFKHGVHEATGKTWISLYLHVEGGSLIFKMLNGREGQAPDNLAITGGLGLQNVRKRLNLLYPGRHQLKIMAAEDTFMVTLQIQLNDPHKASPQNNYYAAEMPYSR